MSRTSSSRRPARGSRGFLVVLAITAAMASFVGMTAAPAGAAQTPPFGTPGLVDLRTATGSNPATVVVGDSLLYSVPAQGQADNLRNQTGRTTLVEATPGASWVTYGWPGQQNNNNLVWDLANWMDSRITVVALATNDARLMTQHPSSYTPTTQYSVMHGAVDQIRQHSQCVLLVNVKPQNVPGMSAANANLVNAHMTWLQATYSGGGVYIADWANYAQLSWFVPNDVHLNGTGKIYYRGWITAMVKHIIQHNNC